MLARVGRKAYEALGAPSVVTVTGTRGSVTLPLEVVDMVDDTIWLPANSSGRGVLAGLAAPGSPVTVQGAVS